MNAYKKGFIGLMISLSFVAIGAYVRQEIGINQGKYLDTLGHKARITAQESYVETAFPEHAGKFYVSFDRASCRDPLPSKIVDYTLVVFTSLACQICRNVHTKVFPMLQTSKLYKSGKLRIVFVEYPADRISFFASKYVWGNPIKSADQRRRMLMEQQSKWAGLPSEAAQLKAVKKILGQISPLSQEALKEVFTKKMEAQKIFGIQDVPFFVVYQHKQPKGKRIKHHIGEIEHAPFLEWIQNS
jgi:protein-disulfide isomerase